MPTFLTPKEIIAELDRFVVGQDNAKRAVAIALRNRWRRKHVPEDIKEEIVPHNILMVGPTGVGKTEIAKRLAKLTSSPFIKVEATKFTEVGYVGRDVDSIIRDLMDISINLVRENMRKEVTEKATIAAEVKLIDAMVGENASEETKLKFYEKFRKGKMDGSEVEIKVADNPSMNLPTFDIPGMPGGQMGVLSIGDVLGKALGGQKTKTVKLNVKDAFEALLKEESDKLLDEEKVIRESTRLVENEGIVFIDEIDKIASRTASQGRGEVSREGVQRDLLPLLEGTVVTTKYGSVKTDHILFVASGAFHLAKPSDLLPELQGRLPIRVELNPLTEEDMVKILKDPAHSLPKQYTALLAVENVELEFSEDGLREIAKVATEINQEVENIGARRLHTIMEKLLEGVSFSATETPYAKVTVNRDYVVDNLTSLTKTHDLSKFIL
ncbi:ATP-dependent protease HslVU, ATPase subunit HslU [endosymbiont of Acanthamoeba sp. UWC8]|uniref:ATP-dependent protease ATPase subunit HslU n=1 Tax=endosymbiont of Acanthamoeba sp. UWC8 TaxID=86106 RepID=UPI0004D15338|nr:ATP-dependent protease ATPase subunit HslU [endosymbiont of Acanthamoeba sp. UWC8]AIF81950.1 ATP-dependent protease HslVU, ATPase subunit HslU [endosymbiont of Acanthamoeba sp. UWC8]